MEVRSNNEQCGNDAAAVVTASTAPTEAATESLTKAINQSMNLNETTVVATRTAFEMDPSRTMVDDIKLPLTRDESKCSQDIFFFDFFMRVFFSIRAVQM